MTVNVEDYYRKYGPMVIRRCRQLLKNEERALDAMQDVFVQVLRKKDALTSDAPSSLLYTIATNICLNIIRKEKKTLDTDMDDVLLCMAGRDNPEERILNRQFINSLFENEKSSTRTIAVLHYVDRFTLEQTAEMTGLSVSGVRKRLRKLRERGLLLKEE